MALRWTGTILFAQGAQGWSESWHSGTAEDSAQRMKRLHELASVRADALSVHARIVGYRVSDPNIRGDSSIDIDLSEQKDSDFGQGNSGDIASSAWYCQVTGDDLVKRQLFLRGMPDSWYALKTGNVDPELAPVPAGLAAFVNVFRDTLRRTGWGLAGQSADRRIPIRVKDITADPDTGQMLIETLGGFGFAIEPGDVFRIYRPNWNQIQETLLHVQELDGLTIKTYELARPGMFYGGGATLRVRAIDFCPVQKIAPVRPTRRKTGAAFFVPAGRQKARR